MREFLKTDRVLESYVIAAVFFKYPVTEKLAYLPTRAHSPVYHREFVEFIQLSDQ